MKLIAGLGNPGPRYAGSRHNVGFMVTDELARRWNVDLSRLTARFHGMCGQAQRGGDSVMLLKPMTFMNRSGQSVASLGRYYKVPVEDTLIVHDDLDLGVGQLRLRPAGSAGGHNGLSDVIRHLGTDAVPRLRLGIGRVHRDATVDYVLGGFKPDEQPVIDATVNTAADAVECWLSSGIETAMNTFNRKRNGDATARQGSRDNPSEGDAS